MVTLKSTYRLKKAAKTVTQCSRPNLQYSSISSYSSKTCYCLVSTSELLDCQSVTATAAQCMLVTVLSIVGYCLVGAGKILRLGEKKNWGKTSTTVKLKYNSMHCVFFRKRYMRCTMGSGVKLGEAEELCFSFYY